MLVKKVGLFIWLKILFVMVYIKGLFVNVDSWSFAVMTAVIFFFISTALMGKLFVSGFVIDIIFGLVFLIS